MEIYADWERILRDWGYWHLEKNLVISKYIRTFAAEKSATADALGESATRYMAATTHKSAINAPPSRSHIHIKKQLHMGKIVGIAGTIRGKVGTIVYSKGEKGVSYARQYQPQVVNPKTVGQQDQRAKMNLVGRMSQVTPKDLLVGMNGVNNRQRRSDFNRHLMDVATIDRTAPDSVIAKIAPEDVIFSRGSIGIAATAGAATINPSSVVVPLTLSDSALAGKYGERIIVAIIDPSDKAGYSKIAYRDIVLDNTTATQVTINLGSGMDDRSLVAIYRVPFKLSEEGATLRYETLSNNGTDITATLLLPASTYVQGYGNSLFAEKQVFTEA